MQNYWGLRIVKLVIFYVHALSILWTVVIAVYKNMFDELFMGWIFYGYVQIIMLIIKVYKCFFLLLAFNFDRKNTCLIFFEQKNNEYLT
jgi:hypothetical protein